MFLENLPSLSGEQSWRHQLPTYEEAPSVLYTYLAVGVGNSEGKKAFRALKHGYIHYASNRIYKIELQNRHSSYAFLRMSTNPSIKPGLYKVSMVLQKDHIEGKCM